MYRFINTLASILKWILLMFSGPFVVFQHSELMFWRGMFQPKPRPLPEKNQRKSDTNCGVLVNLVYIYNSNLKVFGCSGWRLCPFEMLQYVNLSACFTKWSFKKKHWPVGSYGKQSIYMIYDQNIFPVSVYLILFYCIISSIFFPHDLSHSLFICLPPSSFSQCRWNLSVKLPRPALLNTPSSH